MAIPDECTENAAEELEWSWLGQGRGYSSSPSHLQHRWPKELWTNGNDTVAILPPPAISDAGLSLTRRKTLDLMASVDISSTDLSNCLLNPCKRGDLLLPLYPTEGCKSRLCCNNQRNRQHSSGCFPGCCTTAAAASALSRETEISLILLLLTKAPVMVLEVRNRGLITPEPPRCLLVGSARGSQLLAFEHLCRVRNGLCSRSTDELRKKGPLRQETVFSC